MMNDFPLLLAEGELRTTFEWGRIHSNADWILPIAACIISLLLVVLTALLTVSSVLVSWESIRNQAAGFYACLLFLETGLLGAFCAFDLLLFYVFANLVGWVVPLILPVDSVLGQVVVMLSLLISLLIVFADYVIVFEDLGFLQALRRSVQLLARRWLSVLLIFIILQLLYTGVYLLYSLYSQDTGRVFILLPISQILVESVIVLVADLVLIYLYEDIRRSSPA